MARRNSAAASFSPEFADFVRDTEPRLRRALVALWGPETGRDATAEALAYAWTHWERVQDLENPAGYLYTVGRRSVRIDKAPRIYEVAPEPHEPWVEPHLDMGLRTLTEHQRVAIVLHHSFGWTYQEVARLLDLSVSSVRNHIERGMQKLRSVLEVTVDG